MGSSRIHLGPLTAVFVLAAACAEAPPEDVSVLLVTPDSLRLDRLLPFAAGGAGAPPTPHLERLASRGTVYRNAWATSPWTAPSVVSVMSGLYPPSHGVTYRDDTTPADLPTLPRLLAARGYRIGNFSFFSEISYFRNLGLGERVEGLFLHEEVPEAFRRWLGELEPEEPFFAWTHLLETHLPYGATGYRAQEARVKGSPGLERAQRSATVPVGSVEFAPGDRERLLELYDLDVVAMDRSLGVILDALEASGRLRTTLVVYVADHGEEILDGDAEDRWIGHASTSRVAKLLPEILHVPLILAGPGVPVGEVRDELATQVDVLPSVLGLLGLAVPSPIDGVPLPGLRLRRSPWQAVAGFLGGRETHGQVFFDTSPGGNLTPQDQHGVRLQGASDGRCTWAVRTRPGAAEEVLGNGCREDAAGDLRGALGEWRKRQSEQRLAVLGGEAGAPASDVAEAYAERIEILEPDGKPLVWEETRGQIVLAWNGRGDTYWLEYDAGRGPLGITGSFRLDQRQVAFGPVPQGFWNDLAAYSPFRIRLLDAENEERSPWLVLEVRPAS